MKHINFQLVTPEKTVLQKELVSLTCPTTMGLITILPNHEPLVATLAPGELKVKTEREEMFLNISGGFVQVKQGGSVIVLADAAEHSFEIDERRAKEAKTRAEKALKETKVTAGEYAKVAAALERSTSRLKVARKHAQKKQPLAGSGIFSE